jgi:catechol 2,3-dioxygenase-like lactoylglutathione lyase family enzyme
MERVMTAESAANQTFDMKFEVAVIPVSDIDRSKRFYEGLGWRLDADFVRSDESRAVQLTPPGSPSSIQLGPGPGARFYLVVNDIEAARAEFVARGVDVSEIFRRGVGKDSRLLRPPSLATVPLTPETAPFAWPACLLRAYSGAGFKGTRHASGPLRWKRPESSATFRAQRV